MGSPLPSYIPLQTTKFMQLWIDLKAKLLPPYTSINLALQIIHRRNRKHLMIPLSLSGSWAICRVQHLQGHFLSHPVQFVSISWMTLQFQVLSAGKILGEHMLFYLVCLERPPQYWGTYFSTHGTHLPRQGLCWWLAIRKLWGNPDESKGKVANF